ncbi:hypothetical protein PWT90_10532 [Aphanocladium album]|nr:hypothetical protein PWT90_10532 [Aphanocladium album]
MPYEGAQAYLARWRRISRPRDGPRVLHYCRCWSQGAGEATNAGDTPATSRSEHRPTPMLSRRAGTVHHDNLGRPPATRHGSVLAADLQKCVAALLRLAGPRHLPLASGQPSCYWNFQAPQSAGLQLWEIPVEGGSAFGGVMPTVVVPTLPVLRFLRRASRAAVRAMPLLTGPSSTLAVHELNRLQYWVDAIDQLFVDPSARQGLISTKLGLLEEMKSLHGDSGDNGLLFTFLDQKDTPQTYRYLDDRDVPYAGENENSNKVTLESLAPDEDSESSDGSL